MMEVELNSDRDRKSILETEQLQREQVLGVGGWFIGLSAAR